MPLFDKPSFAREVAYNLNLEIRRQLRVAVELGRTPLLEQEGKSTPFLAVSIAASIESFYRSAMNASINAALSGQTRVAKGALFPNMHLQVLAVYVVGPCVCPRLAASRTQGTHLFLLTGSNESDVHQWFQRDPTLAGQQSDSKGRAQH